MRRLIFFAYVLRMANQDRSTTLAAALGVERCEIPAAYLKAMDWAHRIHQLSI